MKSDNNFPEFENIINEMTYVYKHDNRPWLIGYSGGKDSSLLVTLVVETVFAFARICAHQENIHCYVGYGR